MQHRTVQYSTLQYNTVTHIPQNSRQPSKCKIKKKIQEHILYPIKTQKLVETKVNESVLKTTRCTKEWVNQTV